MSDKEERTWYGRCFFCDCLFSNKYLRLTKCDEDGKKIDVLICDRCLQDQRNEEMEKEYAN